MAICEEPPVWQLDICKNLLHGKCVNIPYLQVILPGLSRSICSLVGPYFFSSWAMWGAKFSSLSFCNIFTRLFSLPTIKINKFYNDMLPQVLDEENQYSPFFCCCPIEWALETSLPVTTTSESWIIFM